jgi:hypothetical protein
VSQQTTDKIDSYHAADAAAAAYFPIVNFITSRSVSFSDNDDAYLQARRYIFFLQNLLLFAKKIN